MYIYKKYTWLDISQFVCLLVSCKSNFQKKILLVLQAQAAAVRNGKKYNNNTFGKCNDTADNKAACLKQECIRSKANRLLHDRNQNTYNLNMEWPWPQDDLDLQITLTLITTLIPKLVTTKEFGVQQSKKPNLPKQPWPWHNFDSQTWPKYDRGDYPHGQKWSFYVKAFKSFSPNGHTDR